MRRRTEGGEFEPGRFRLRARIVVGLLCLTACALLVRAVHLQVLDRVRCAPSLAHQVRDRSLEGRAVRLAEAAPVKDQIAVVCGPRDRHRRYRGG